MKPKLTHHALTAASAAIVAVAAIAAGPASADTPMQEGAAAQQGASSTADDSAISNKVSSALIQDEKISHLPIHVTTSNGVVQLSGFANSEDEANRAEDVASQVPGVKEVQNNIEWSQSRSSEAPAQGPTPSPSSRPGY